MTDNTSSDLRPTVITTDPKIENGPMVVAATDQMGVRNLAINPAGKYSHIIPHTNLNYLHHYFDAYWSNNLKHQRSVIPMVRNAVNSFIPEPKRMDSEAGQFFIDGYRLGPEIYILSEIVDGRVPYPAGFWELSSDPNEFLIWVKRIAARRNTGSTVRDKIERYVIAKARSFLNKYQTQGLERYFEEFRAGSERFTAIYNSASHLGLYGKEDSLPLSILRKECCFLVIATPLELMNEYGPFQAQFIRSLIEMAKITPGRTLHLIAEEAGTALPEGIEKDLTIIRGLNIKIDFVFQRDQQFAEKAGEQGQQALDSQIDVSIYGGVSRSDEKTCRKISEVYGKTTETVSNVNTSSDGSGSSSLNVDRRTKENITPNDVAELPRDKAFVLVSNARGKGVKQPKTIVEKVNYGQILPHRDVLGFNYVENKPPLFSEEIAIHMQYKAGKAPICLNASDPASFEAEPVWTAEDEPFFTPYSFIWAYVLLAMIAAAEIFTPFSLMPF